MLSNQLAQAGESNEAGVSFREFRQQKSGLDRHAARRLFQSERHRDRVDVVYKTPVNRINDTTFKFGRTDRRDSSVLRFDRPPVIERIGQQSVQSLSSGRIVRLKSGVELDLTSTDRSITLGKNLFTDGQLVQISTGSKTISLSAGKQVTASEYLAVKQVLTGGGQRISIDNAGRAVGGEVDLGALTDQGDLLRASSLVVAENVTTHVDFGKHSDFRLNGDLSNFGTINASNGNGDSKGGAIRAVDLTNHEGALIQSAVDLILEADGNLLNNGTISSAANLTVSAGGSLVNDGALSAAGSIDVKAANVRNSGLVRAENGNVNLRGFLEAPLVINNTGGTIEAANGAVAVRDNTYTGVHDSSLFGGDVLSRELSLNSGNGLISVDVGKLTGVVNQTGTAAHLKAATDVLSLGDICLTGDPTYFNTQGDIEILGDVLVGEALTIIASGNIICDPAIDIEAGDATQGFPITLIAGADFVNEGGSNRTTIPPLTDSGSVTLSGKSSKTGGSILFDDNTRIVARSTDLVGNDPGAGIFLYAFQGKNAGSGAIDVSGASLETGGRGTSTNGEIRLIAGVNGSKKSSVDAILTGVLDTTGGANSTGDIRVITGQPVSSIKGADITYNASGERTSTARLDASAKFSKSANVRIEELGVGLVAGRDVRIRAGGEFILEGDVAAQSIVDVVALGGFRTVGSPNPITSGVLVALASNGNIGVVDSLTPVDQIPVSAPLVVAHTKGDFVTLQISGTGTTQLEVSASSAIDIRALQRTLKSQTFITAPDVLLLADDFDFIESIEAKDSLRLNSQKNITNAQFGSISTRILNLEAADIGAPGDPFILPETVASLSVTGSEDVRILSTTTKSIYAEFLGTDFLDFNASGSASIGFARADLGSLNISTTTGTLTLQEDIEAITGIVLSNTSIKGKLVLSSGIEISTSAKDPGLGSIVVSLGVNGTVPFVGEPVNLDTVNNGGNVLLIGSQKAVDGGLVKAVGPVNTLHVQGANIDINNGTSKAANFSFGGDVLIFADP